MGGNYQCLEVVLKKLMRQTADERFLNEVLPIPELTPEQRANLYPEDYRAGYEEAQRILAEITRRKKTRRRSR